MKPWLNTISCIDDDGKYRLNIEWISLIAKKIYEINSICVLNFKHHWFKKYDNRKFKSPFFQAWGVCKFSNTISVTFSIKNDFNSIDYNAIAIGYHSNGDISLEHADNKTTLAPHIISCEIKKSKIAACADAFPFRGITTTTTILSFNFYFNLYFNRIN